MNLNLDNKITSLNKYLIAKIYSHFGHTNNGHFEFTDDYWQLCDIEFKTQIQIRAYIDKAFSWLDEPAAKI